MQAVTATTGTDAASTWFNRFGLGAIMPAEAMAYSAFAPQNCGLVTPWTSSPRLKPITPCPNSSTIPDKSAPRVRGGSGADLALPLADEGVPWAHSRSDDSHQPIPLVDQRHTNWSVAQSTGCGESSEAATDNDHTRQHRLHQQVEHVS